ncbi:PD-(D/E)XK nuclease family protein, partial [Candidatus Magnetobacterium casense]
GPGRPKPKPYQKSEHHAVLGVVIQSVVERFYNDELWSLLRGKQLVDRLLDLAQEAMKVELAKRYIDWRLAPPRVELEKVIKDGVLGYLRTLQAHHLLGPYARAEVDLLGYVNKYTPVGGRADVVIRRESDPGKGVTILDGKNGKRYRDGRKGVGVHTDPDQLRWYALCFYLVYQAIPDRLGFVYYRYPFGAPVLDAEGKETGGIEQGVEWVNCTKDDLKGLGQRAVDTVKLIEKQQFEAKPVPKTCKFCDYESVCPERQAQRVSNRRSPSGGLPESTGLEVIDL